MERRSLLRALGVCTVAGLAGCAQEPEDGGDEPAADQDDGAGNGDAETGDQDGDTAADGDGETADDGDTGDGEPADGDGDAGDEDAGGEAADGDGVDSGTYPSVDEWLTETEVGDEAPNYDGSIEDRRDADSVEVEVGAGENGFAFEPAAVAVAPGTTVEWTWTGEGGAHNVVAAPDQQLGESDYEFSSGEPVDAEDETYEETFDEEGIALYHCEPHLGVGMKGAVVVAE